MTQDPNELFRIARREWKVQLERKANAEQDLLLSARYPDRYSEDILASAREDLVVAIAKIEELGKRMEELGKEPSVQNMLKREQGLVSTSNEWEPLLRTFTDIEERKVPWLWYPVIPIGRLTILEGDPGQGKSWFSLATATCVSLGGWMELVAGDESWREPGGVLYMTSEDDPEDTIKKRLRILQADQARIHHLSGKARRGTQTMSLTLKDLPVIEQAAKQTSAKLLIIDPIQAYMPGGADMNRAEQVRPLLSALQKMATDLGIGVLIVRHLTKGSKDQALYKGMGSIDFTAAARSVLMCAERKDQEEFRVADGEMTPKIFKRRFAVAQVKNNISARAPTIEFELQHDTFLWVGTSDITPDQLLSPTKSVGVEGANVQDAKKFLITVLQKGGIPVVEIKKQARQAGIDNLPLSSAKTELQVETRCDDTGWCWFLPGRYQAH